MLSSSQSVNELSGAAVGNGNFEFEEMDKKVNDYKKQALQKIKFAIILKPAIISFVALILSFFIDVSVVPVLGNISVDLAKVLFPTWQPATETVIPYSFWWLPIVVYAFFAFLAYLAYSKLLLEVNRTPASETIDRIISSYMSVIDSIATALPLLGAAILLLSIKLGEEVFVGLSVPFEIKALIILALGKLFEPVLDQLGLEFQRVVSHVQDMREKYFSQVQIENAKNLLEHKNSGDSKLMSLSAISPGDLELYKNTLENASQLSSVMLKNFNAVYVIIEKLNSSQNISAEKIEQFKSFADSMTKASIALSDEKTLAGLKSLESIVVKR